MDYVGERYEVVIADMGREIWLKCKDCPRDAHIKAYRSLMFKVDLDSINSEIGAHEKKFHTERTTFKARKSGAPGWEPMMTMSVHKQDKCSGEFCVIHKPSVHHMRFWPIVFDPELNFLASRICEHGEMHPDPDSLAHMKRIGLNYSLHFGCENDNEDRICCCIEESE